ncbi:MAG: PAS domain S-box protein [Nitrospirae bacterium]|nr:MAG: PAS domain S-box protein [Nitrospirota bacterium]
MLYISILGFCVLLLSNLLLLYLYSKKTKDLRKKESEIKNLIELLNSVNEGIYITDTDRRFIFWNKAAEKITGYSAKEIMGKSCYDDILRHKDYTGKVMCTDMCPIASSIQNNKTLGPEVVSLKKKDGTRIMVEVMTSPLKNLDGEVIGGIEVFRDVTRRIEHQKQLDRKKKELETVLENITDGVLFLDSDGRIIHINNALKGMLGLDDSVVGKEVFSLPKEHALRNAIFRVDRDFKGPYCWENYGCTGKTDCPEYKSYCCRCWLLSKYGSAERKVINCADCNSFKKAKEFLQKHKELVIGDRVISVCSSFIEKVELSEIWEVILLRDVTAEKLDAVIKLSGAAAHEIRQPLQALVGAVSLLRDEIPVMSKETEKYLDIAERSCFRIDDVLKRLLNITKYKVKYYTEGTEILDVFEASSMEDRRGSSEEEVK